MLLFLNLKHLKGAKIKKIVGSSPGNKENGKINTGKGKFSLTGNLPGSQNYEVMKESSPHLSWAI